MERQSLSTEGVKIGNQQQSIHDSHAEKGDESDSRRDAETRTGQIQSPNAADRQSEDVAQNHEGVKERPERRVEQKEDKEQRERDDNHETALGILHLLELATPDRAVRRLEAVFGSFLSLGHGTAQVSTANTKLDRDQALALLAVDTGSAVALELTSGVRRPIVPHGAYQFPQRHSRRMLGHRVGGVRQGAALRGCRYSEARRRGDGPGSLGQHHRVVADIHGNVQDRRLAATQSLGPAYSDIEELLAFDHVGLRFGAQSAGNDVVDVGRHHAPLLALLRIDAELQMRLAPNMEDANVLDARDAFQDALRLGP